MLDTDEDCLGNVREGPSVWNAATSVQYELVGGHARGDVWTNWWPGDDVAGQANLNVGWGRDDGNCYPAAYDPKCSMKCPQEATQGWDYSGFELREYEYARYESGASPYFPPFRFPGQYWDPETDLYENWHRYYYPFRVGYLSPEPMVQKPDWVREQAQRGLAVPTYAYALNNPIRNTDPTGLEAPPTSGPSNRGCNLDSESDIARGCEPPRCDPEKLEFTLTTPEDIREGASVDRMLYICRRELRGGRGAYPEFVTWSGGSGLRQLKINCYFCIERSPNRMCPEGAQ